MSPCPCTQVLAPISAALRRRTGSPWTREPGRPGYAGTGPSLFPRSLLLLSLALSLPAGCRCDRPLAPAPGPSPGHEARPAAQGLRPALLLSMARFRKTTGDDGRPRIAPVPARLVLLERGSQGWLPAATVDDPGSQVFHKARCLEPLPGSKPGSRRMLTIGGTGAFLKIWTCSGGTCTAETLWEGRFGGRRDRLRDFEVADVTGDGVPDLVLATHDQGVVAVLRGAGQGPAWRPTLPALELRRSAGTFVHEVEVGDLDGDGRPEIYATPSQPNRADASQSGEIIALVPEPGTDRFHEVPVGAFRDRHVKEVLVADLDRDGRSELYASLEARLGRSGGAVVVQQPLEVLRYLPSPKGGYLYETVATLQGAVQARVLLPGDLDADGKFEVVVTTMKAGVLQLLPAAGPRGTWSVTTIDSGSGGFEHAATVADLDGDGRQELFVVSDNDHELREYRMTGSAFARQVLYPMSPDDMVWSVDPCPGR